EVDEQRTLSRLGEAGGKIDGRRRLADTALLVRERVDAGWHMPRLVMPADTSARVSSSAACAFATSDPARQADASRPSRVAAETPAASGPPCAGPGTRAGSRRDCPPAARQ